MQWDEDDAEALPAWWPPYKPIILSKAEMDAMYDRIVRAFDERCDQLEKEDTDYKVAQIIHDCWGPRSYQIPGN